VPGVLGTLRAGQAFLEGGAAVPEWVIITEQQRKELMALRHGLVDLVEGNGIWATGAGLDEEEKTRLDMAAAVLLSMATHPRGRLRI
jgi:hypothetical protein